MVCPAWGIDAGLTLVAGLARGFFGSETCVSHKGTGGCVVRRIAAGRAWRMHPADMRYQHSRTVVSGNRLLNTKVVRMPIYGLRGDM
jgi:hypothetical protein